MFRGDPRSFCMDASSLALAKSICDNEEQKHSYRYHEMVSILLVFVHQEDPAECERSANEVFKLIYRCNKEGNLMFKEFFEGNMKWCMTRKEILIKYGRYPMRNQTLGR